MRFLVTVKQKYMVSPEVQLELFDRTLAYAKKYANSQKIDQQFGFAGKHGGGAILNVNSLEELNQMASEFPLGAIGEIEIYPLVGFEEAVNQAKKAVSAVIKK